MLIFFSKNKKIAIKTNNSIATPLWRTVYTINCFKVRIGRLVGTFIFLKDILWNEIPIQKKEKNNKNK